MNKPNGIVVLTGNGEYPLFVYNYVKDCGFEIKKLIIEEPVRTVPFLRKRLKKLGWSIVIGQILQRVLVVPILKRESRQRISNLKHHAVLDSTPPDEKDKILFRTSSVNSKKCKEELIKLSPKLVLLVNTRIVNKEILNCINGKFINIHAGITPNYRGWHGGYWALVNRDVENCGVTIHLVDLGIDTGTILYQDTIDISVKDNYYTYPYLQLIKGLPLIKKAIQDVLDNNVQLRKIAMIKHSLYYHPTLFEYIKNRLIHGVK